MIVSFIYPNFMWSSMIRIDGALLVYDITDAESFHKVTKWVKELRKIVGNDICIAIAGNKIDLEKDRHVDEKDALSYAESVGAVHYNTSAKINKGLEEVFGDLSKSKLSVRILEDDIFVTIIPSRFSDYNKMYS